MDDMLKKTPLEILHFLCQKAKRNDVSFWCARQWRQFRWCCKALESLIKGESSLASRTAGADMAKELSRGKRACSFDAIAAIQRGALGEVEDFADYVFAFL